MEDRPRLVYIGFITGVEPIPGADRIHLATAVCGVGGKWRGIVTKDLQPGALVVVFQPDSLLPQDNPDFAFMAQYKFRVKQRLFRGVPSEALILPASEGEVGEEVTLKYKVDKYVNPQQMQFSSDAAGIFPTNVPKTDEMNIQTVEEMIGIMNGLPFYITQKMDGMSSTAFKWQGHFGVCSRNLELEEGNNPIWNMAKAHNVESWLPEGMAVQWETCGPSIQGNPIGLKRVEAFAFQMWNINQCRYLDLKEFRNLCQMPTVPPIQEGVVFDRDLGSLQELAKQQVYPNKAAAEGIVVRPQQEQWAMVNTQTRRISFKVINLLYKA